MKNIILIIVLLTRLKIVLAQNNAERVFLSPTGNKQLTYVELAGQHATVFKLGRWIDKGGVGYSTIYIDTLIRQPDINKFLFTNKTTTLQQAGNRLYLDSRINDLKRIKTIELDTAGNTDLINSNINNAYWWNKFLKMCDDINSTFELSHYSFRNGFGIWESFDNKTINYEQFRVHADNRINLLKDSINAINTPFLILTNSVIRNIGTIDYSPLKDSLVKLSSGPTSVGYFGAIVNSISNNRPELFFKLADDMPDKKEILFSAVYGKGAISRLKTVQTDSPAKKEFIKEKRRDRGFTIKAIGIAIVGAALLGFSVYTLAK